MSLISHMHGGVVKWWCHDDVIDGEAPSIVLPISSPIMYRFNGVLYNPEPRNLSTTLCSLWWDHSDQKYPQVLSKDKRQLRSVSKSSDLTSRNSSNLKYQSHNLYVSFSTCMFNSYLLFDFSCYLSLYTFPSAIFSCTLRNCLCPFLFPCRVVVFLEGTQRV